MNRSIRSIIFGSKVVLCLTLTLNLSVWAMGCGQVGYSLLGEVTIPLTADHPLAAALKGSDFEGATALAVSPSTHQFRLIFPDGRREMSGTYQPADGQARLTAVTLTTAAQSVTLQLDGDKHVTQIVNNAGSQWQRPAEWNTQGSYVPGAPAAPRAPAAPSAPSSGRTIAPDADAYLQANAELLELARQADQQSGDDTGGLVKAEQSSLFWVPFALLNLVFVPGGVLATLLFVFQVIALIDFLIP
jgi:hypothetical protein